MLPDIAKKRIAIESKSRVIIAVWFVPTDIKTNKYYFSGWIVAPTGIKLNNYRLIPKAELYKVDFFVILTLTEPLLKNYK